MSLWGQVWVLGLRRVEDMFHAKSDSVLSCFVVIFTLSCAAFAGKLFNYHGIGA